MLFCSNCLAQTSHIFKFSSEQKLSVNGTTSSVDFYYDVNQNNLYYTCIDFIDSNGIKLFKRNIIDVQLKQDTINLNGKFSSVSDVIVNDHFIVVLAYDSLYYYHKTSHKLIASIAIKNCNKLLKLDNGLILNYATYAFHPLSGPIGANLVLTKLDTLSNKISKISKIVPIHGLEFSIRVHQWITSYNNQIFVCKPLTGQINLYNEQLISTDSFTVGNLNIIDNSIVSNFLDSISLRMHKVVDSLLLMKTDHAIINNFLSNSSPFFNKKYLYSHYLVPKDSVISRVERIFVINDNLYAQIKEPDSLTSLRTFHKYGLDNGYVLKSTQQQKFDRVNALTLEDYYAFPCQYSYKVPQGNKLYYFSNWMLSESDAKNYLPINPVKFQSLRDSLAEENIPMSLLIYDEQ